MQSCLSNSSAFFFSEKQKSIVESCLRNVLVYKCSHSYQHRYPLCQKVWDISRDVVIMTWFSFHFPCIPDILTPTYWQAKLFPLNTFCRVGYSITKAYTTGLAATAFHNKLWRCVLMKLRYLFCYFSPLLLKDILPTTGSTGIGLSAMDHETITAYNIIRPPSKTSRPKGHRKWCDCNWKRGKRGGIRAKLS